MATSSRTPDLGRDVDAFCSRCGLVLAHTVTAKLGDRIVRVMCNTCKREHAYRSSDDTAAPRRGRDPGEARRQPRTTATTSAFARLLGDRDAATAVAYRPTHTFVLSDLLQHPTFGLGVVSEVKSQGKIEVVFRDAVRVLVHGR
ncbi:MAG: hypothetical protein JXR83_06590 [Deltaproteobacteria bacterium]|nr:hypothetical protein [Deltaproteobacteria bacterium]